MTKEEFTQKMEQLQRQTEAVRAEYLDTNRPIDPGKLVTVYEGKDVHKKGMLMGYKIVGNRIYYDIAPLTKNGTPHKTLRLSYDISDRVFRVLSGVTI